MRMDFLISLWIPILLAAVAVFVVSFVCWMVLPLHKHDFTPMADDGPLRSAVRGVGLKPGRYMFPFARDAASRKSKEFMAKYEEGPTGIITIFRPMNMGVNMLLTFAVFLAATFLIGYLLSITLQRGNDFWRVFQVATTIGVLTYSFSQVPYQIWYQATRANKIACFVEGVVYGITTGLVFALLWPK
jgi:hypothetical protein